MSELNKSKMCTLQSCRVHKLVQSFWQSMQKCNFGAQFDLANPLVEIYSQEMTGHVYKDDLIAAP